MATERVEETLWIWSDERMIKKQISYVPRLYKFFDETLVSAADGDGVKDIQVTIDVADSMISVRTNFECGDDVPEVTVRKFREAIGFSTEFTITRADGNDLSKEVFTNNMEKRTFQKYKSDENYTMVSFKPDLPKFGMQRLEDDIVALMKRRVVDLAGCLRNGVKVQLDTSVLPKSFLDYVDLYLQTSTTHTTRIYEKLNNGWEICVAIANVHFEHFQQVSFVNNIATMKGGSHVDYITSQITNYVAECVDLLPHDIESYLWVFVNAYIDKPEFDSQTKENLTTDEGIFKSTCQLTEEFLNKIADSLADSHILLQSDDDDVGNLNIPELQDANLAGTRDAEHCTLILTRGECALVFAMSQLSYMGRDKYGVLPLRNKLLNVREASPEQLAKNSDIQNIKKMLGLQDGESYENVKKLRYGHLMIMFDEDHDGLEMKGLLINFLHYFWPSLLKVDNFLLIAPVVTIQSEGGGESYFRGSDQQHIKKFVWVNDEDGKAIEHAFSNMKIEALEAPEDGTDFDTKDKCIRYLDFIDQEFKPHVLGDLKRSIPSIMDGLKPCQRKILFYALRKPIIERIGVYDFSDYVSEHSSYDDEDEESLVGTIIGMAQNYVGSNNINLLQPNGRRFGTRATGGKDHASASSLFTQLSPITRYIFHKGDDLLLNYLIEDGQSIEPDWFIPIIPMVLVNGSEARGAAWSSFIPNYNPREIIANLKRLLKGKTMVPMLPWYKGFKGHIGKIASKDDTSSYVTKGIIIVEDHKNALTISELPVTSWTEDYKELLETASWGGEDIEAYNDYNDDTSVHIEIKMTEGQMNRARQEGQEGLLDKFKLTTTLSTTNMYLFNEKGELTKYETPEQILQDFYRVRLDFYKKRRILLLRKLKKDALLLENKVRFINEVWDGKIQFNKDKSVRCANLKAKGFESLPLIEQEVDRLLEKEGIKAGDEKPQANASEMVPGTEYDYLLSTPTATMEEEDLKELEKEMEAKNADFEVLLTMTDFKSLWQRDLCDLDKQLAAEYPLVKKKAKRARNAAGGSANKKRRIQ